MVSGTIENNPWILYDSKTGTNLVSIPTDFTELCVVTTYQQGKLMCIIPRDLATGGSSYYNGAYIGDDNTADAIWLMSPQGTAIQILGFRWGSNKSLVENTSTSVYYR